MYYRLTLFTVIVCCVTKGSSKTSDQYVDLSYLLSEDTKIWPGHLPFNMTVFHITSLEPNIVQSEWLVMASHFGTHLDAPRHFAPNGWSVDQIPQENLQGPGVVVNTQEKAYKIPNYAVTREDLMDFEKKHGRIPDRAIVFFNNGWGKLWNDSEKYLGTAGKDTSKLSYPGVSKEGAEFLINERNVVGIGVDSIALDPANNFDFECHVALASANKWGLEALANLHLLPPTGFQVYVFPLMLKGASGSSARVIAFL